jgi:chromosomal replication initiation ATPase DnaA
MTQIPFEFAHPASLAPDDFVASESNSAAFAWIERWPDWPAPALCVYGPVGAGKSHLGELWRRRSGSVRLAPGRLADFATVPELAETARAFLLDDVDRALDPAVERGLFHLHNALAARGGHLLLLARRPPAHWPIELADLRSRLAAAPAVALGSPDDLLLKAVMAKLFADRQLAVPPEVLDYIAARIERSFAAAAAAVAALDRESLALGRGVTLQRARAMLERTGGQATGDAPDD